MDKVNKTIQEKAIYFKESEKNGNMGKQLKLFVPLYVISEIVCFNEKISVLSSFGLLGRYASTCTTDRRFPSACQRNNSR